MRIIVYKVTDRIHHFFEKHRVYACHASEVYKTQYPCRWFVGKVNENEREEQKKLLESLIAKEGALENRIVIFIPEEPPMLKEWFSALWNTLFNGKGERLPPPQPYDDDHLGGKEEADRYKRTIAEDEEVTEIEFIQTFMEEKNMPVNNAVTEAELEELLDKIVKDENKVDAVFVTRTGGTQPILYPLERRGWKVDIDKYKIQLSPFTELLNSMSKAGALGNLVQAVFHFKQGVISITRLGDRNPLYLFFVSVADNSFGALSHVDFIRDEYLGEITDKLKELGKIS